MLVMSGMVVRFSGKETPVSPEKCGKGGSSDGIFRDAELGPATINRQEKHPLWPRALTSGSAVFHDPEPQSPSALVSSFFLLLRFALVLFCRFCISASTVQRLRANWPDSTSHVNKLPTSAESASIGPSMPAPAILVNPVSQPSERQPRS